MSKQCVRAEDFREHSRSASVDAMFARLVWIPLVLVACSKRADENRAVSATDTPGAKSDNGVGAPTPPTGGEGIGFMRVADE